MDLTSSKLTKFGICNIKFTTAKMKQLGRLGNCTLKLLIQIDVIYRRQNPNEDYN